MELVISPAQIATFVIVLAAFISALVFIVRPLFKLMSEVREFVDAMRGEPARADLGKPERPGLFVTVARHTEALDDIRREVQTNGGGSLKDEVRLLSARMDALTHALGEPSINASQPKQDVAA